MSLNFNLERNRRHAPILAGPLPSCRRPGLWLLLLGSLGAACARSPEPPAPALTPAPLSPAPPAASATPAGSGWQVYGGSPITPDDNLASGRRCRKLMPCECGKPEPCQCMRDVACPRPIGSPGP